MKLHIFRPAKGGMRKLMKQISAHGHRVTVTQNNKGDGMFTVSVDGQFVGKSNRPARLLQEWIDNCCKLKRVSGRNVANDKF